jgi:hypothetical protein
MKNVGCAKSVLHTRTSPLEWTRVCNQPLRGKLHTLPLDDAARDKPRA